jgi:hypothetical protein
LVHFYYGIIFSHKDRTITYLFGNSAIMFFACLSSADPSRDACVYVTSMHAHQLILSLSVAGHWSVLVMFSFILGPVANIIPCEKIVLGPPTAKYLSREKFSLLIW